MEERVLTRKEYEEEIKKQDLNRDIFIYESPYENTSYESYLRALQDVEIEVDKEMK